MLENLCCKVVGARIVEWFFLEAVLTVKEYFMFFSKKETILLWAIFSIIVAIILGSDLYISLNLQMLYFSNGLICFLPLCIHSVPCEVITLVELPTGPQWEENMQRLTCQATVPYPTPVAMTVAFFCTFCLFFGYDNGLLVPHGTWIKSHRGALTLRDR